MSRLLAYRPLSATLVLGALLCFIASGITVLSYSALARGEPLSSLLENPNRAPAAVSVLNAERQDGKVGPPPVIEIPLPESPPSLPASSWKDDHPAQNGQTEIPVILDHAAHPAPLGYLGVRYITAEDGPAGVSVLGVFAGSPAERAGFSAVPPTSWASEALRVGLMVLVLSPAAPLAMPLLLVHKHYREQLQGDLIVAVAGQAVRDAHEFNDVMHRFGSGDTVSFVVQRGRTRVHLSAQLEAEPSDIRTVNQRADTAETFSPDK